MPKYMEFEVSFRDVEPRIWRRFLLPKDATFWKLYCAIQDAGGWGWEHLYEFWRAEGRRGRIPVATALMPGFDGGWVAADDSEAPAVDEVPLASYFTRAGTKCVYTYDFGDDWELDVQFKRTVELEEEFPRRLLDGARAYPPEDCGGVGGYYDCLETVSQPEPESSGEQDESLGLYSQREWLGDWAPDIDLATVKDRFDHPEKYRDEFDDDQDEDDDELDDEDDQEQDKG